MIKELVFLLINLFPNLNKVFVLSPICNTEAFLALLRAGLWERDIKFSEYKGVDYNELYSLAKEQAVLGLIAAGLGHVCDVKVSRDIALTFIGNALQLEQRNTSMNRFVAELIDQLRKFGVYTLLVKGQGVAQCYERPLWRSAGDIDLLLSAENYSKAKSFFDKVADYSKEGSVKEQDSLHLEYGVRGWTVELHGTLHTNLSKRIDVGLDSIQEEIFKNRDVRTWENNKVVVFLPDPNSDVVFVFCHILQHFFQGGIGLRQVCDWCRLIWTYRDAIEKDLLLNRLKEMGLVSEWKVFSAVAVEILHMPMDSMPLYEKGYNNKAKRVFSYILEVGNFGHNKDRGYTNQYHGVVRKIITFGHQAKDSLKLSCIFPIDAPRFLIRYLFEGSKQFVR